MIPVSEARKIILKSINLLGTETVELDACLFRVLAEPVEARRDVPPHDNSAMDGFALASSSASGASDKTPVSLAIVRVLARVSQSRSRAFPLSFHLLAGMERPSGL